MQICVFISGQSDEILQLDLAGVEFSGHHWRGRDISTENSLQDWG